MYPDITDIEVLKKKIANQGIVIAEQNKLKEEVKSNTTMINAWKNLVGQTFEYNVSDVLSSDSNVETVDNSNIIYTNEVSLQEEI
jgi:hypothetical protein